MTNGMTIGHKFFLRLAKEAHKENPNENHSRDLYENFVGKYQLTDQEVSGIASNLFGAGSGRYCSASRLCIPLFMSEQIRARAL